jgi:hypothetical protein
MSAREWGRNAQTLAVARSIYLRLPEGAKLWDRGKEFTALSRQAVRAALGAAAR